MPDLEKLLERLIQHGVEFIISGGYAAMVHGVSHITFDVDVCGPLTLQNLARLQTAVADLHPFQRTTSNEIPFTLREEFAHGLKDLHLKTDLGHLGFHGSLPDSHDFAFARKHSISMKLPFGECRLLDIPTLIHAKQTVGRFKDLLVTAQLRAILDATLQPLQ